MDQRKRRWEVVDVRDDPEGHDDLLQRFYNQLMVPSFPPEELDELDVWRESLPEHYPKSIFRILLLLSAPFPADAKETDATTKLPLLDPPYVGQHEAVKEEYCREVGGGLVFEYYLQSRCGFVSYVVVSPDHRGQGLAQHLLSKAAQLMRCDAVKCHNAPLRAIFLETHSPEKVDAETDTISPHVRVRIMHQLGFRRVVVDFFQPPLAEGKDAFKNLWLGVYQPTAESRADAIDADLVRSFIDEYWLDCCGLTFANSDDYQEMVRQFKPDVKHFAVIDFVVSPPPDKTEQ